MFDQSKTLAVLGDVLEERIRQHLKWGDESDKLDKFWVYLMEEVGEAAQAFQVEVYGEGKPTDAGDLDKELVQVSAVAIKMAELVREYRKRKGD